jgi:RNA polymerase sigma factor (sigma-70 family)
VDTYPAIMAAFFTNATAEQAIINGLHAGGTERRIHEKKLYEQFFYFIKQGVLKYRLPEPECASAYSDTIISVINNIVTNKFEGRASLKSYTYQIFTNKCVDLLRKETTHKSKVHHTTALDSLVTELPDGVRSIIQELIVRNEWTQMQQKLREIGDKCRQLLLYFEDGYSDKEIAVLMQYNSADVVKTSRLRCIEKLREKVSGKDRSYE